MIEVIVTVVGILGIGCVIGEVIWRCMERSVEMRSGFTPGRRTRGITRWWHRCTRWTLMRRIEPHKATHGALRPEPWVSMHDAIAAWNDRPTDAEFAAAPTLDMDTVDRLLPSGQYIKTSVPDACRKYGWKVVGEDGLELIGSRPRDLLD